MNKEIFFFDTYALFEIIKGNENYTKYAKVGGVTTIFNIAEFNYNLKKERSKEEANKITDDFKSKTIKVEWEDVKKATDLKIKQKDLSIPDAIGYTVAKRLEIKFLTGDDDFKDFYNVEFVKK